MYYILYYNVYTIMASVRLPEHIEKKLSALSTRKNKSRSVIIREALVEYIAREESATQPYETGKTFFGKRASGDTDRSVTYKSRIKEKLRDKQPD